jgi:hypothetical protein
MYDYVLGGKDNFGVDRQAAERIMAAAPDIAHVARQNREFLKRAVEYVAGDGVAQFIDIGCGLPTGENTHEIAQRVIPAARVVYVDNDPMAVAHARALLADNMNVIAIDGDLRDPGAILGKPGLKSLVDVSRPVAIILASVLHFVAGPLAGEVVDRLKRWVPRGSYLVISHATIEQAPLEELEVMRKEYKDALSPVTGRTAAEIAQFFDGFEIVRPGVVNIEAWRNPYLRNAPARTIFYGGAARKGTKRAPRAGRVPGS